MDSSLEPTATDIIQIPPPAGETVSARDAARSLASFRLKQREGESDATPAPEPARAADAPSAEAPRAELLPADAVAETPQEEIADTAEPPASEAPIEPPRSWTQAARERFQTLPRETQQYLAEREAEREGELRRQHNEAAEQRNALAAERERTLEARTRYEEALPDALTALRAQQAADFPDVRSLADVERLARADWPRYMLFDAQQKRIAQAERELVVVGERQKEERSQRLAALMSRESELLNEKIPEMADPAQRLKLQGAAIGLMHELGFSQRELDELYQGRKELSLHDHRLQLLLRDGVRFREAHKAAKEASAKPVPPVQRPGVAQHKGAAQDAVVHSLAKRLEQTGSLKDAARLLAERRKAR